MEKNSAKGLKKYQNLVFPIIAVIIGLIMLGLLIVPQGLKIPETNSQIDAIRKRAAALNQKIGQLSGVDVNQYQQDLNSSLVSMPDEKDIPGAMSLMFNLLRNNSLTLNGLSFSSAELPASGSATFAFKVDVRGSKDSLTSLISQLKESPRVVQVDSLTTSTTAEETTMQILVGLNAFYQALPDQQNLDLEKPVELPTAKNRETLATIKDYYNRNLSYITDATGSASPLGKPDPFQ